MRHIKLLAISSIGIFGCQQQAQRIEQPEKQQRTARIAETQPAALSISPVGVQHLTVESTFTGDPRLRYDLNGDGRVDVLDLAMVRGCLGFDAANTADAMKRPECETCDVNVDWKVDVLDMVIVRNNMDGR